MAHLHNTTSASSVSKDSLATRLAASVEWLAEHKALDVAEIDLSCRHAFADALVVCGAQSVRQAQALADGLASFCGERGYEFLGMEGYAAGQWILVDMNDIIVNIFQEQSRQLYRLEDLWREAGKQAQTAVPLPGEI